MNFVIFHGAFSSPDANWFPELKEKLEQLGQTVLVPEFPIDSWEDVTQAGSKVFFKNQTLSSWLTAFEKQVLPKIKKGERYCFVGHSLGPLFILHVVEQYKIHLDSAIFVSPFLGTLGKAWQIDAANKTFYKTDFDFSLLKKLIPVSYVLCSDNDPYVDKKHSQLFAAQLDSSLIFVKRAGHMNAEVNLNEFPLVYELCKTRLDLSLYQRYLERRQQLFAANYMKGRHEEVVYLQPEEIFDEGVFHFRNLGKSGFCTFYTGVRFWDAQGPYFEEARKAARRIKNFIRVFIVEKKEDLKRPLVLNQIRLDLQAGINVYLCALEDIRDKVGEIDFGIWDEDYLCIVRINKKNDVQEVCLSSRGKDIQEAKMWKKVILDHAVKIRNIDTDVRVFIKERY